MDLLTFIMCWIVFAVIAGWRFYIWKNESKAGITLEDRNDTFGAKFFGVRMRTIDFVLLNFVTGNSSSPTSAMTCPSASRSVTPRPGSWSFSSSSVSLS